MSRGIDECRSLLSAATGPELQRLIEELAADQRRGVRRLVEQARRRHAAQITERARVRQLGALERTLRSQGFRAVAGLDEVGRGALAGPVTVAAVILPPDAMIDGLDDSKLLTRSARERVAATVARTAVSCHVTHVAAHVIDAIGLTAAIRGGMERALAALHPPPDHALTDGHAFGLSIQETSLVKGDSRVAAIAAASIVAKVARDAVMDRLGCAYPAWGFEENKGYGTPSHRAAIEAHGVSHVHRRCFAPCACEPRLF